MAELFGVQRPAITKHLKNIFESGELEEKLVCSVLEHTTKHNTIKCKTQIQNVKYYNLDAILSVGYRVNSHQATQFRIWASKILKGNDIISNKQAEQKVFAEYVKFSKTQKINSDFEKQIEKLKYTK